MALHTGGPQTVLGTASALKLAIVTADFPRVLGFLHQAQLRRQRTGPARVRGHNCDPRLVAPPRRARLNRRKPGQSTRARERIEREILKCRK